MELLDIAKLVYEATRVKEDRLLMKWEDDRCALYNEIERLRDNNEHLRQRLENTEETLEHQIRENTRIVSSFSCFGTKTKTSPPTAPVNNTTKAAPATKNNKKATSTSSSGKPAVPRYVSDAAEDDFMTIDHNKTTGVPKKGQIPSYFRGPETPQTVPAPSSSSTANASRGRNDRRVSDASMTGGLWEHEANTEGDIDLLVTQEFHTGEVAKLTPLSAAKNPFSLTATNDIDPSGNRTHAEPAASPLSSLRSPPPSSYPAEEHQQPHLRDAHRQLLQEEPSFLVDEEATCAGEMDTTVLPTQDAADSQATCASQPTTQQGLSAISANATARSDTTAGTGMVLSADGRRTSLRCSNSFYPPSQSQTQSPALSQEFYIAVQNGDADATVAVPARNAAADAAAAEIIDLSDSPNKENGRQLSKQLSASNLLQASLQNAQKGDVTKKGLNLFSPDMGVAAGADAASDFLAADSPYKKKGPVSNRSNKAGGVVAASDGGSGGSGRKRRPDESAVLSPRKVKSPPGPQDASWEGAGEWAGARAGAADGTSATNAAHAVERKEGRESKGKPSNAGTGAARVSSSSATANHASSSGRGNKAAAPAAAEDSEAEDAPAERATTAARCGAARVSAVSAQPGKAAAANTSTTTSAAAKSKTIESVRSKTLRAALPGFACEECRKFYETMDQQGIYNLNDSQVRREVMQSCSRHKSRWTPPSTPEGFWSLTLQTPDDWH